ncbi:MAG: DEAD/DEAH box helicase family protein [Opitutales bacterium]|nr:DEAD/DEAH box helicase family protein [Opitutales bacterium]
MSKSGSELFIVDNSDSDWKVRRYLREWCQLSKAIDVATGYFEVAGLLALEGAWQTVPEIRILMGDEVSKRTKKAFAEGLAQISDRLDQSIETEKSQNDFLKGVPAIVEALRTGQIQCRVYRKDKFHAKAYITHAQSEVVGSAALVGSSNLTFPGICQNVELNVQITGAQVSSLQEWYDRHWEDAEDVTPDILRVMEHHTMDRSPFEIWAKALFEYARDRGVSPDQWDREESTVFKILAGYQRDAYRNLVEIANRYGMAFLCDGVGLGKTYVGLMLIERLVAKEGKRVALMAPKAAKEDVWQPAIESLLPHLESDFQPLVKYSHTDLQRTADRWPERMERTLRDADVVIIDEAHHFRNPGIAGEGTLEKSRYRKLQEYLSSEGGRPKQVFFLTATPINNSIHDFRHIIGLVSGENQAYFAQGSRNLGIHNLRSFFNALDAEFGRQIREGLGEAEVFAALKEEGKGADLFSELVVQRSRGYVRASEKLEDDGQVLFPEREAPRVADYQLKVTYGRLLDAVATAFDREKPLFALALYSPLAYLKEPPSETDFNLGRQVQVVSLIRTLFLKRFESSAKAFEMSCWRLLHKLLTWADVHATRDHDQRRLDRWRTKHHKLLEHVGHNPTVQAEFWPDDESVEEEEFISDEDRAAVQRLDPDLYKVQDMLDETMDDLEQVADFLRLVRDVRPDRDSKLTALVRLLRDDKELKGRKVILFTEFSDTAAYLEYHLKDRGLERVQRIDGNSNQKQRSAVIHRFAPFYNGANTPPENEGIDILIATDILAEGLNLQDADRLINFDLHWNPVRLMQRIGRVDRRLNPATEAKILAAHPHLVGNRGRVVYWNFLPPDELETLLRIYNRVNRKTLIISKAFGIEGRKLLRPDDEFDPVKEINEQFEGQQTPSEALALEYQELAKAHPDLVKRLPQFPLKTFSGRATPVPDARAVFFCFRIPRPDSSQLDPGSGEHLWTEAAGDTVWLLYDTEGKALPSEPARVAAFIRSKPDTPRRTVFDHADLSKLRAKAEKDLLKSHLRPLQAPVGVSPVLKCWMEIN